jgi:uncharacterized protein
MLKEKIQEDLSLAVKNSDEIARSVLRMILAASTNKEKEKRYKISKNDTKIKEEELVKKSELSEEEMMDIIFSEAKKRKESILEFEKGNRDELARKEKSELVFLEKYLPAQLSEDELRKITEDTIVKTGAKSQKDIGKIMAEIMPKIKGKADGSAITKIIKEILP